MERKDALFSGYLDAITAASVHVNADSSVSRSEKKGVSRDDLAALTFHSNGEPWVDSAPR